MAATTKITGGTPEDDKRLKYLVLPGEFDLGAPDLTTAFSAYELSQIPPGIRSLTDSYPKKDGKGGK